MTVSELTILAAKQNHLKGNPKDWPKDDNFYRGLFQIAKIITLSRGMTQEEADEIEKWEHMSDEEAYETAVAIHESLKNCG